MKHLNNRRTIRLVVLAAVALIAFVVWTTSTSAQPTEPPFRVFGEGDPGDVITIYDTEGAELGTAVVMADNSWYANIPCDADKVLTLSFQVNGEAAEADVNLHGSNLAEVTLNTASDSEMMEEGEMLEDEMSEDGEMMSEDEMVEDDSEMMESDEEQMDETMEDGYPDSGSGGLADQGPSTGALAGTIAVLAALVIGFGAYQLRRVRNRA